MKDRIHLDLHHLEGDDAREAEVARLIELGADASCGTASRVRSDG